MSDPQYGDPVEDETQTAGTPSVDDAVARARAGLADAEAATRDIAPDEVVTGASEPLAETVVTDASAAETVVTDAPAVDYAARYADEPVDENYVPGAYSGDAQPTEVVAPSVVPPAVVVPAAVAPAAAPSPQPVFVQAPEAPRPRGNRGAAGLIGILAALAFGVLYLAAALGLRAGAGELAVADLGTAAVAALTTWWFWVPVAVFFLGFWLLGAVLNRGRWGHWVIFGLFVGVVSYGGHIVGQLFQAPFWTLTAQQGQALVEGQLLAPLAVIAGVIGRELTIWFGAWVAARGKRMSELNREAQREYERTLEAGPRIQQG